jgi:hypothetical protein
VATTVELSNPDVRFEQILDRLTAMSERDYYNPYQVFEWPDELPEKQYWMSPDLMTIHGTAVERELSEEQLWALSKWESINFYSLNVHGIRELLIEVISRIHTSGFERPSEYFHHLVGEENEHMWFFATFCLRYGKRIYPDKQLRWEGEGQDDAANFLVFMRLLLFEEIVDFFNKRMATDERLHPTIRQVNAIHHQDESRHIAFGRQAVAHLHGELRKTLPKERLAELERYCKTYIRASVDSLCSPTAYKDAGVENPYEVRNRVLADPSHDDFRQKILKRTMTFMVREQIFADGDLPAS